ncbi:hypothetical protein AD943_05755 [Gluconobacter roseus]|nr:hypothetical protein AD943_05755 [Gluconobacter roseus]
MAGGRVALNLFMCHRSAIWPRQKLKGLSMISSGGRLKFTGRPSREGWAALQIGVFLSNILNVLA